MKIIGRGYTVEEFRERVGKARWESWTPSLVVIHHTAAPSLLQRPLGFLPEHMQNLREFYEGKGWSAGPHLFIDDRRIWEFTPITQRGVHAIAFNRTGLGIEMLGDYDTEDPWRGRGLDVLRNTRLAVRSLLPRIGISIGAIRFHRDDPQTSKTCPGSRIAKRRFLDFILNDGAG